uniref:non-specific serine/threonine protein kinase n=1 Tax=Solanum chacoense TaxID=4108 RepID=A0A0V0H427_SOLCH
MAFVRMHNTRSWFTSMEWGSLSSILSNEVESKKLDWLTRVNIIKGVAYALSYMHQIAHPRLFIETYQAVMFCLIPSMKLVFQILA